MLSCRARKIEIKLSDMKTELPAADRAIVAFRQDYASSGYADSGVKTLEMRLLAGRWLIVSETAKSGR